MNPTQYQLEWAGRLVAATGAQPIYWFRAMRDGPGPSPAKFTPWANSNLVIKAQRDSRVEWHVVTLTGHHEGALVKVKGESPYHQYWTAEEAFAFAGLEGATQGGSW